MSRRESHHKCFVRGYTIVNLWRAHPIKSHVNLRGLLLSNYCSWLTNFLLVWHDDILTLEFCERVASGKRRLIFYSKKYIYLKIWIKFLSYLNINTYYVSYKDCTENSSSWYIYSFDLLSFTILGVWDLFSHV